jgi:uncharacterized protein (TIGR03437 family)
MTKQVRTAIIFFLPLIAPIVGSAATQTITFDAIPDQIFGVSPFPIAAKASSGLPVTFTSTTPAVCKTASALVLLLSTGSCQITASQAGNSTYGAATPVSRSFTIDQAGPSGTLTPTSGGSYPFLSGPQSIVSGDFNGDGIADLAVATIDGPIWILLGNGSGGFAATSGSPYTAGSNPTCIVVGDFNGDGFADLAIANESSASLTVLLGDGSGGFTQAKGSPFAVGPHPYAVAVGDFNDDGIQDLVATSIDNVAVIVLLGNGQGGFSAAGTFSVGLGPMSVAVADFNGDGFDDVATANNFDNTVSVLLGNGAGGFTAAPGSPFAVGASPIAIAVGDFNLDGIPDLAVANQAAASLSVLIGNGSGGFAAATGSPFPVPGRVGGPASEPIGLVVGDLNGDGFPDVAVANYGPSCVTVLMGNGKGGFTAAVGGPFPVGALPYSVVVNDFNGDGIEDIATANRGAQNITVLLGGTAPTSSVLSTTSPLTIAAGQSIPLTLTVSDTGGGFDSPTGTATFKDGSSVLGMADGTGPYTFTAAGLAVGSHVLTASYSGDSRSAGSSSNSISIQVNVGRTAQSILFEPLSNLSFGSMLPLLSTSATSGLAVLLTSNTPAVCNTSGMALSLVALGTCSITASQPGNADFAPAIPVTQTFTVNQGMQTITFTSQPAVVLPVPSYGLMATSSSGLPVSFTSSTPSICTVNPNSFLIPVAAGTCMITASQAGNVNYAAAAPVTQPILIVTRANSVGTLNLSPYTPALAGNYGGAPVTQTATLTYQTTVAGTYSFESTTVLTPTSGGAWLSVSPSSGPMVQTSVENSKYTYSATITFTGDPAGLAGTYSYDESVVFGVNGAIASFAVLLDIDQSYAQIGGITNAASASQASPSVIAPGSYVSIYGTALAGGGNPSATTLPLPTSLNGASISLGGLPMPLLYASASQINALVPQGLEPNTSYPFAITVGGLKFAPVMVSVTEFQPGIYTVDSSGSGPGIVANAVTGQLNSSSNPAHAGDYLVVYGTGLGLVHGQNDEAPPADGVAAPENTVYSTTASVTATIGGVNAPVFFSGLTPGFAGLYQVNVQMPAGVAAGSFVPLVISATNGSAMVQSNSVTIVVD